MSEATHNIAREKGNILLWAGMLAGPIAWALQLEVSYMLVGTACSQDRKLMMHLVSLAALGLAGLGAALSLAAWRRLHAGPMDEGDDRETRRRFMALAGLVLSLSFALVIIALEIPNWMLRPCD